MMIQIVLVMMTIVMVITMMILIVMVMIVMMMVIMKVDGDDADLNRKGYKIRHTYIYNIQERIQYTYTSRIVSDDKVDDADFFEHFATPSSIAGLVPDDMTHSMDIAHAQDINIMNGVAVARPPNKFLGLACCRETEPACLQMNVFSCDLYLGLPYDILLRS
ncbi:hypothetical protein M8J77_012945 [Diaphorina citri]|nr:hypothetical protein M8J77_012945 [Diaphorina citri]